MTNIAATTVLRILNEEDIEGLLAVGAPHDEYEAEARLIIDELDRRPSRELDLDDVTTVVTNVCNQMFGPFDDEELGRRVPVYRRVAKRIVEAQP
jgi:hypothetical protein